GDRLAELLVRDVDLARTVDGDAGELLARDRALRDGLHGERAERDLADVQVVDVVVEDVERAAAKGDGHGIGEARGRAGHVDLAGLAGRAGDGVDGAVGELDAADDVVAVVGDIGVTGTVAGDA